MQGEGMRKRSDTKAGVLPGSYAGEVSGSGEVEQPAKFKRGSAVIDRETLKEYRQDKLSWREIADALGVTLAIIRRVVRGFGLGDDKVYYRNTCNRKTVEDMAREAGYDSVRMMVIEYRYQGKTCADVAKVLGCSAHSVAQNSKVGDLDLPLTPKQIESRRENGRKLNEYLTATGKRHKME
jgi:transposase